MLQFTIQKNREEAVNRKTHIMNKRLEKIVQLHPVTTIQSVVSEIRVALIIANLRGHTEEERSLIRMYLSEHPIT